MAKTLEFVPLGGATGVARLPIPNDTAKDFTFARSGTDGTLVNADGNIVDVAGADIPRYDFLNEGGCPALLLERDSTNICIYSNEFTHGQWSKNDLTITANTSISPDGTMNASTYEATDIDPIMEQVITDNSTDTYSAFVYVKGVGTTIGKTARLYLVRDSYAEALYSDFTITSEWQKMQITKTFASAPTTSMRFRLDLPNNAIIGEQVYVYGAQVETLSYSTSYIPTSASTATRNAETCNDAGSTDEIGQEGIIYIEKKALVNDGTNRIYGINNSGVGFNDSVIMRYATTDNRIIAQTRVGGSYSFELNHDLLDATIYNKIAFKYKQDDFALYVNGLLVGVGIGNVSAGLDNFGFSFIGGNHFYGKVKKLSIYNDTTQDLEELTGFSSFAEMSSYLLYS